MTGISDGERATVIARLHAGDCSCVIRSGGETLVCHERGVKDLFRLLTESPAVLSGAFIADKVVGKGAAALMVLGGVAEVYADVISRPALTLLSGADIKVACGECVDNIINRKGDGICPVEALCMNCLTADGCLPLIEEFINGNSK